MTAEHVERASDDSTFRSMLNDGLGWCAYGGDEALYVVLKNFLNAIPADSPKRNYDHTALSKATGGAAAWMLIYAFVRLDWIEYGTSPRFGWLSDKGMWLWNYVRTRTPEQLADIHQRDE